MMGKSNNGIGNWDVVLDAIYRHILCSPTDLTVVCKKCHDHIHETGELYRLKMVLSAITEIIPISLKMSGKAVNTANLNLPKLPKGGKIAPTPAAELAAFNEQVEEANIGSQELWDAAHPNGGRDVS